MSEDLELMRWLLRAILKVAYRDAKLWTRYGVPVISERQLERTLFGSHSHPRFRAITWDYHRQLAIRAALKILVEEGRMRCVDKDFGFYTVADLLDQLAAVSCR